MANQIRIKRGLESARSGVTPAEGEFLYTTDEKKVYIGDGTTAGGILVSGSGGTAENWTKKTTTYTAVAGDVVVADTSSAAWTLTLPASPAAGDVVKVVDHTGTFATNNLTVDPGTTNLEGATTDAVLTFSDVMSMFYYDGTEWKIYNITMDSHRTNEAYLTGPTTGNESATIELQIADYSGSSTYSVAVTGGTYIRYGALIQWTLPAVTVTTTKTMTLTKNGTLTYDHDVSVINISTTADTSISITDFSQNTSNDGWTI